MGNHFKRGLYVNSYDGTYSWLNPCVRKKSHETTLVLKKHLVFVKASSCGGENTVVCTEQPVRTLCQPKILMWAQGSGDSKGKLEFPHQIACQPFGKAWQAATSVLPLPDLRAHKPGTL